MNCVVEERRGSGMPCGCDGNNAKGDFTYLVLFICEFEWSREEEVKPGLFLINWVA